MAGMTWIETQKVLIQGLVNLEPCLSRWALTRIMPPPFWVSRKRLIIWRPANGSMGLPLLIWLTQSLFERDGSLLQGSTSCR